MTRGRRRPTRALTALAVAVVVVLGAAPGAVAQGTEANDGGLGGTPVPDTSTDPGAPVPLEAGLWADSLDAGTVEAPHQFVYRRTMADSQVHVGVGAIGAAPDSTEGVELETFAADGTDCPTVSATSSYGVPGALGGAVVVGATEPGERGTACGDTDEIRIVVGRSDPATAPELSAVVRIVEEAPATVGDEAALDAATPSTVGAPPTSGTAEPVQGSTSFPDAPLVDGGTVSGTVTEGAVGLYRVRLERGQSLAVGVEVPRKDAAAQEVLEDYQDPSVDLTLVDPARTVVSGLADDSVTSTDYADADDDVEVLRDGVPAVSWLRGFDGDFASLPGDYWVSLAVGDVDAPEDVDVPVVLTVEVRDDSRPDGPAAPAYPDVVTGPGGTAGPEGYAASTPFLVAPGEFAAEVVADPGASVAAGGGGPAGRSVARTAGGAALGVAGLVCLAGGAVLLRRRRPA